MFTRTVEPDRNVRVVTVHLGAELDNAHQLMRAHVVSALAVVDANEHPVGVLSMTDLIRAGRLHSSDGARVALHLPHQRVEQQMRRGIITMDAADDLGVAARLMIEHHIHRVFVMNKGTLTGVVSTKDLAEQLSLQRSTTPVRRYATSPVQTVDGKLPLGDAINRLNDAGVRGLVVMDDAWPIGFLTQAEALAARERPSFTPVEEAMSFALVCVPEDTPLWRAAGHASTSRARRLLTVDKNHEVAGILSGIDFATAYLAEQASAQGLEAGDEHPIPAG